MKGQRFTKVIAVHPEDNVNVRFHGNPGKSCGDIWFEVTNVNLMVALEEKSEDHQSH